MNDGQTLTDEQIDAQEFSLVLNRPPEQMVKPSGETFIKWNTVWKSAGLLYPGMYVAQHCVIFHTRQNMASALIVTYMNMTTSKTMVKTYEVNATCSVDDVRQKVQETHTAFVKAMRENDYSMDVTIKHAPASQ